MLCRSTASGRNAPEFSFIKIASEIDGVSYEGVPLIVASGTMRIEWLPTEYLLYNAIVSGRTRSPKTWKALGHMMAPFLNFMEERGFDWRSPTEERLARYRNALEKRGLGRARIHRVMTFICAFYEWARGLCPEKCVTAVAG
jgi:hypothetical protein